MSEAMESGLWRGVGLAEVDGGVGVVCSWLLDTSCCCSVGVLIDGRLHLLQELVNVHEIRLGAYSGQWKSVLVLRHMSTVVSAMAINRNQRWTRWNVLGDSTSVDRKSLQSHQALADLSIGVGINLTTLGITKELVQGVISALPSVISGMVAKITTMADWVVNRGVRRWLLRSIVPIVG
jgi:hypothetical protein